MRENSSTFLSVPGLRFNVAQLLKEITGASRSYTVHATVDQPLDDDLALTAPLNGEVKFLRTGNDVLVMGNLQSQIHKACGRCLTEFVAEISLDLEETFHPTMNVVTGAALPLDPDVEEANLIDEQHILDLSEVVRQELILAAEGVRYCSDDCQGLCASCGQNLNEGTCDCDTEVIDQRWAGLLTLNVED